MATQAQANNSLPLSVDAQTSVIKYAQSVFANMNWGQDLRAKFLEQDRNYMRELDYTDPHVKARLANVNGDPRKLQNVVIPIVAPQVESAVAFFADTFLNSYPIFPVVVPPAMVDAGLQLETILGQSAQHYQWARHLAMCFRDGLKYNLLALEVDWFTEKIPSVINDASQDVNLGIPQEVDFAGNKLRRIDPYNLIFDRRVAPCEVHKVGEFAGYSELMNRIQLKQLLLDLDRSLTMNATQAFQSGTAATTTELTQTSTFYVPQVNPFSLLQKGYSHHNWLSWAQLDTKKKIHYSDMYEVTTLYARIIPAEFGIHRPGGKKTAGVPQIYKFLVVNQKVVIFAQRMTNAHSMLPIVVGQMVEDGLGLQTKSYADNATPYQQLSSGLYNSAIESQRKKVYDRIVYDPSRINKSDIDRVDPVARIPVKTEAYGKPVSEALYMAPYRDEGIAGILGIAREVVDMADVATGQNRVQRGQFQKGNKTRFEVNEVMSNSDARPKMSALLLGVSWLQPIKEQLKYNILQYQPPASLFNQQQQQEVNVNPVELRKVAWEFQMADGTLPADKMLNFELFGQVLQYASAVPGAAAEWDLSGMFAYQLKMQGARWVDQFKRTPEQQQAYLQQLQQAQQPPQQPAGPTSSAQGAA